MAMSKDQIPVVGDPGCINEANLVHLVKSLKIINHQKSSNKLGRLLISRWKHPIGKSRPALVLHMNHYVNDIERKVYIPGEIAFATFTIESGLGDSKLWTLIDPGDKIRSHGIEAQANAIYYGFPSPGYSGGCSNFSGVVNEIDALVEETGLNKPISRIARSRTFNSGYIIFCLQDNIQDYTQGLQWLYEQAGSKFRHRILPLESLIVILSMAGLDNIADQNDKEITTVYQHFQAASNAITTLTSGTATTSLNTLDAVHNKLKSVFKHVEKDTRISFQEFSKMGTSQRLASTQPEKYPYAMLGAFIFEQQATHFLKHMDFLCIKSLACDFHQDKASFPPQLVEWMNKRKQRPYDKRPSYQMTKCALLNVQKQIFLALDVLVVNYRIKVVEGKHYPKPEPSGC